MGNKIDLTGRRFGRLVVQREAESKHNEATWLCRCDCGNEVIVTGYKLRHGHTQSCGCLRAENGKTHAIDLTGQRFGRLTVVERSGSIDSFAAWKCRCDCGNERIVDGGNLKQGHVKSCGCSRWKRPSMDLTGKMFGRLTVIKEGDRKIQPNGKKRRTWLCHCQCGKEAVVLQENLTRGITRSCGCLKSDMLRERRGEKRVSAERRR